MNTKTTSIVTYIPVLGFVLALLIGDKNSEEAKLHINQSLVISILLVALSVCGGILGIIPLLGKLIGFIFWIASILLLILAVSCAVLAAKDTILEIPVICDIKIIK